MQAGKDGWRPSPCTPPPPPLSDLSISHADYWDRHLAATQQRYLRARETLARVRRQLHPTLQVHIAPLGGQQVNVSGDIRLDRDGE